MLPKSLNQYFHKNCHQGVGMMPGGQVPLAGWLRDDHDCNDHDDHNRDCDYHDH